MILLKNISHIYGFEDYGIVSLYSNLFTQTWDYTLSYRYDQSPGNYIIAKDLPVKVSKIYNPCSYNNTIVFEPALCENHRELLNTAKKLYTHPSCKLSRSLMAEKYKKSLNPFLSDAVIIPTPDYDELRLDTEALFINEEARLLVKIHVNTEDSDTVRIVNNLIEGCLLGTCISCNLQTGWHEPPFKIADVLNSEFVYAGPILFIPNSQSYVMDILTNNIPVDKVVFEESVQESLSSETNQLTLDSLVSIKDMLDSSDENTVAAALKSLSMMDWMHYPNSIRFIINQTDKCKWIYNKATNSTSVKYMLNTMSGSNNRRRWPGSYDDGIYNEDWELFRQLKMYYTHIPQEKILDSVRSINFIIISSEGILRPNIKERAL